VVAVRLALWLMPFRHLRAVLSWYTRRFPEREATDRAAVARVVWAVKAASRRVPDATCLTQALAAQVLLRRQGWGSRLQIGVARDEREGLLAHAWLESGGRVILGGAGRHRYTPLRHREQDAW
jgi:hypothetical protein